MSMSLLSPDVQYPEPESAPLLQNVSHPDDGPEYPEEEPTLLDRLSAIVQEPLSPLTQILLIATLLFLILSSVFIGLFAGAQHKLNTGAGGGKTTVVVTSTATTTSQVTTTAVTTTTVAIPAPVPTTPPVEPVCISPSCINLASSVLSSLDETEDPCENFYDFANGGWMKANPVPSDKGQFGHDEEIEQRNNRLLQQILSEDSFSRFSSVSAFGANPYDELLLKKLRTLYQSCMDEDSLNEIGEAPLRAMAKTIRELFRGKTAVVDAEHTSFEKDRERLTATVAYLHSRGVNALFRTNIDGDAGDDPNLMTLWLSQTKLGLPSKEYYEETSIVDVYRSVLERLLITLSDEDEKSAAVEAALEDEASGLVVHEERLRVWPPWPWPPWGDDDDGDKPDDPVEHAHKMAKNIIEFEKKIANISLDLDVLYQDPIATYNPVPYKNVSDSLPEFDFATYFSTFAPRNFPSTIILTSPTYLADLSTVLGETDKNTLEAYFVTRAALKFASFLGLETEAWKATRSLEEELHGIKKGAVGDRAQYCVSRAESALGFALGRYFVEEAFGGASREKAMKIMTDIIEAFKKSLRNLDWMDEESAAAAAQKADAIRVKVGYPLSPNTEDPRSIANWYSRVKIADDAFFESMVSASAAEQFRMWQTLGKPRDREAWKTMYTTTVNADFSPQANEIMFAAGILQVPVFHADWPGYMNYGSFGGLASHELTHAFDSAGRLYNQDGKLEEWWTKKTSEGFNVRQKCIVDQYSNYTVDDGKGGKIHLNGNLTSGENIGDSGLIQAYRAWKAQYDDESEFLLPGLNYTREQLFFISFARSWGENIKPQAAVARVRTDPHSPNRYRVEGTVSNIPEFAEAFKCSPKAKLNPPQEKRCTFW